ncbi:hypothetical protein HT665_00345 [Ursidibacter maritimus]|uniref:ACP-like domain-containing protein n=1 Tax=Ursidibacter maritimus TaxID=1331689 RepID=A0A949WEC5_9PAST|nr:hypothetical protein [Ursidibacter maritimus]KAE9540490.1 hypothetical protein A1D26_02055 [Ursidibacter maritimus]MBV6523580.1 hypothetical protein [Ursidibacter maritimus]MBV6525080.1 hypothetical protein [Ursidibacter maritimus]MBV6527282.1 hypothetical protein [Ursidibacter maritimus]MBV6528694.1 hypothetical protein [Ursidibacter maritimus]
MSKDTIFKKGVIPFLIFFKQPKMVKDFLMKNNRMFSTVMKTAMTAGIMGLVSIGNVAQASSSNITPLYVSYACQNKVKLEVSYVFVGGKPMTATVKLNRKPAGVLEFNSKQSNEDTRVLSYKKTNLLLDSGFTLENSKENVSVMLTKDTKKTTNILAKNCEIKEYR